MLKEIEDFLYDIYIKNYKKKLQTSFNPITGKTHTIDYLKFDFLTKIHDFQFDFVYAKKSKVHGLGVFAKIPIKKGDLITFYPCDVLEFTPNKDRHVPGHSTAKFESLRYSKAFKNIPPDNDYAFEIDKYYTIVGEKSFTDNPNYLGHLINDGAKCPKDKRGFDIYQQVSFIKSNCKFQVLKEGLHIAIIATKDIDIDQELFIPYGVSYWLSCKD